jgi:hypothetical protein
MHLMQATVQTPLSDRGWRHPEVEQLSSGDHSVLDTDQGPDVSR